MGTINFRDAYEFGPESYVGGGLPGMLRQQLPSGLPFALAVQRHLGWPNSSR